MARRIVDALAWTATAALVAFALVLCVGPLFGLRANVVLSGSMEPAVPTGSLVLSVPADPLASGDVALVRRGSTVYCHRVVERTLDGYVLKGDANDEADFGAVSPADVLGRAVVAVPGAGYLVEAVRRSPVASVALVAGAAVLLLALRMPREEPSAKP